LLEPNSTPCYGENGKFHFGPEGLCSFRPKFLKPKNLSF
jgi:hypothetical protein